MSDVEDAPAVPPFDAKGDVRFGYYLAGGLLVVLGWGLGVATNLLLHVMAPAGGYRIFQVGITGSLGPYAWATMGLGLFTGALGTALLLLARSAPQGPVVLPGYDY